MKKTVDSKKGKKKASKVGLSKPKSKPKPKKSTVPSNTKKSPSLGKLVEKGSQFHRPSTIGVVEGILRNFVKRGQAEEKDGKYKATMKGKALVKDV